jgi:hypothetical protein
MKKLVILLILLCSPAVVSANDAATIMGKAPDDLSTFAGKATSAIATIMGAGVAAGDPDACAGGETMGVTAELSSSTTLSGGSGYLMGAFTAPCTGTLDYAKHLCNTSTAGNAKVSVYLEGDADVAPDDSDTHVAQSASFTCGESGWTSNISFASGSITKNSKYWIVIYPEGTLSIKHNTCDLDVCGYDATCDGYASAFGDLSSCSFGGTVKVSTYVVLK